MKGPSLHPAKVLVIDDEEAARFGISKALEREGHQVELASDGEEALRKIHDFQPQSVISDINMPNMDGITLLKEVGRSECSPPVILITAHGSEAMAIQALRAGAYDYLLKPFDIEELRLVVRNALDKQRLLEENRHYYRELENTLRELKRTQTERIQAEKMASLGRLVAGIAHEVNSPLGALASAIDTFERAFERVRTLLQSRKPGELSSGTEETEKLMRVLSETFRVARDGCHRMDSMVKIMRRFANLDQSPLRKVTIAECIEGTLALLGHEIREEITLIKDFDVTTEVECFPMELNQVFMNLLINSVQAIPGQGEIRIRTWQESGQAFVCISDTGQGIPAECLEKIFDPGFTTKGVGVGTGMGLPICLKIMEMHRGKILVESQPGRGAAFTLHLPIKREDSG
jgi:two-component system NtrC family sensor kinase